MRGTSYTSVSIILSIAFLLGGLVCGPAAAWEFAYGPPTASDAAFRRVAPVVHCPQPGYIAIGTYEVGANSEVYVVYTNLAGWPFWEITYDVGALNQSDEGKAIVELPNGAGFTFVSISRDLVGGPWRTDLTRIDCNGNVHWSQRCTPPNPGDSVIGWDLIRTATPGAPTYGVATGDYVLAGELSSAGGQLRDAFLMRTNAAGVPIWSWRYATGALLDFSAVTEAVPLGAPTGDLVAVGMHHAPGGAQGLVARVSGVTGGFVLPAHCMAHHGGQPSGERYNSVVQLATPPWNGEFAMVGTTSDAAWLDDIWTVVADPCRRIFGQVRIGDPFFPTEENGYDLREVLAAPLAPGVAVGDLAIAGDHDAAWGNLRDGSLLYVNIGGLVPVSGTLFGGPGDENFYSLEESPGGYILAGYTATDWEMVGDPLDLYLVQENPAFPGYDYQPWYPQANPLSSWPTELLPEMNEAVLCEQVATTETAVYHPWQIHP